MRTLYENFTIGLAFILMYVGAGCSSTPSSGLQPRSSLSVPSGVQFFPALGTQAEIDQWMSQRGFHWEKVEISAGPRRLLCVQLMPFSGLPGIYAFVYRKHNDSLSLVFSAMVSKPPHFEKGRSLAFSYESNTDSVVISSDQIECLRTSMTWLYPAAASPPNNTGEAGEK